MTDPLATTDPWESLRQRLLERLAMARDVLEREGLGDVATLVPIEEVLIWMAELDVQAVADRPPPGTIALTVRPSGRCAVFLLDEGGFARPWITDSDTLQALANVDSWVRRRAGG